MKEGINTIFISENTNTAKAFKTKHASNLKL